jgi:hypothetical protein
MKEVVAWNFFIFVGGKFSQMRLAKLEWNQLSRVTLIIS